MVCFNTNQIIRKIGPSKKIDIGRGCERKKFETTPFGSLENASVLQIAQWKTP